MCLVFHEHIAAVLSAYSTSRPYLFLADPQRTEYDALDDFGDQHEDAACRIHQDLRKTRISPRHHTPAHIQESKGIVRKCVDAPTQTNRLSEVR